MIIYNLRNTWRGNSNMWIEYHYKGSKKYTKKRSCNHNLNFAQNLHNKRGNVCITNNETHSYNHCCSRKAISITQPEWVFVTLGIQQRASAILSSVACPTIQYFSTISHKWHDFQNKVIEHQTCVSTLSTTFTETFFILRRTYWDMIKNVHCLPVKYPSFLSNFNETWIFLTGFLKILKHQI